MKSRLVLIPLVMFQIAVASGQSVTRRMKNFVLIQPAPNDQYQLDDELLVYQTDLFGNTSRKTALKKCLALSY